MDGQGVRTVLDTAGTTGLPRLRPADQRVAARGLLVDGVRCPRRRRDRRGGGTDRRLRRGGGQQADLGICRGGFTIVVSGVQSPRPNSVCTGARQWGLRTTVGCDRMCSTKVDTAPGPRPRLALRDALVHAGAAATSVGHARLRSLHAPRSAWFRLPLIAREDHRSVQCWLSRGQGPNLVLLGQRGGQAFTTTPAGRRLGADGAVRRVRRRVRVIEIGDLPQAVAALQCRSGQLRLVKLLSESSIGARGAAWKPWSASAPATWRGTCWCARRAVQGPSRAARSIGRITSRRCRRPTRLEKVRTNHHALLRPGRLPRRGGHRWRLVGRGRVCQAWAAAAWALIWTSWQSRCPPRRSCAVF